MENLINADFNRLKITDVYGEEKVRSSYDSFYEEEYNVGLMTLSKVLAGEEFWWKTKPGKGYKAVLTNVRYAGVIDEMCSRDLYVLADVVPVSPNVFVEEEKEDDDPICYGSSYLRYKDK